MKRNALLCLIVSLYLFCAAPLFAETANKVIVLPFAVNAAPDLAYLEESLPKLLQDRLASMGFEVVSQEETIRLLQEQQVEYLDLGVARDMALLSGAGYAVYGSFSQVGTDYQHRHAAWWKPTASVNRSRFSWSRKA
jgi:outer membrane protein insertion porin family